MSVIINYDVLDMEGNHILDSLEEYEKNILSIKKLVEDLGFYWKSNNYTIYKEKYYKVIKKLENDKKYLEKFGNLIIKTRNEFEKDEKKSSEDIENNFDNLNDITGDEYEK